ncbi:MAG: polysaccharide biosynthesis protein [Rickettsiales bacterium]
MIPFNTDDSLTAEILGRDRSLFADAVEANAGALAAAIEGRRILVAGASGSIGGAFVQQLVRYRPAALHLVDISENSLVELVRELRSSETVLPGDFETFSIDYGSAEFARMCAAHGPHDMFLNFAAMKHVRSERNVFSLLRMIETNVLALQRYLRSEAAQRLATVFSVSTDKVVRPANLMGATKNLMEKCLFSFSGAAKATSSRFANVAFSDGSLLYGFGMRLTKRQPLALPKGIRRYFISHEEAGQLCLLAACAGADREVFFPRMDAAHDAKDFIEIADLYLAHHGLAALPCASEEEAKARIGETTDAWPCFYSETDTTGEKPLEEFFRVTDTPDYARHANIGVVTEADPEAGVMDRFTADIEAFRAGGGWSKEAVVDIIRRAVPELDHNELNRSLDSKM